MTRILTTTTFPAAPPPVAKTAGFWRLLVSIFLLLVIWLGVLPRIGQLAPVAQHLQTLRDHHIDAGTMFYSELDPRVFPDQADLNDFLHSRSHHLPATIYPDAQGRLPR